MKFTPLLVLFALPAAAHIVSMSTGDAALKGSRLDYELRIPAYEVADIANPEQALFANIHFYGGGQEAQLLKHECRLESTNLICNGVYLFVREVQEFRVRCTFPSITVPNHVHLLRALRGDRNDSEAFDASFTEADIRFRAPTLAEKLMRDAGAGFRRAATAAAQVLFLIALVLAARSWRDLAGLFGMFAAGQIASALFVRSITLTLSPRFIEAAAALTIAYLAVEILLLPNAGGRWIVAGVLGLFHGLYFSMLLAGGDYRPVPYLAGAIFAEAAIAGSLRGLTGFVRLHFAVHFQRVFASLLLAVGIGWFLIRLKN